MELGVCTFVERPPAAPDQRGEADAQRLADLLEEIELADRLGLDVFAIGEHHRSDYIASAPAVILGAAAARTKRIKLTTAVTVLSTDDPVRVYQDFATLDLLSRGRAEIMAGRGSFIESFPLFGYDLNDYDELFAEKLDLLLKIRANERVTWSGHHRTPLNGLGVYPRALQKELPIWIAVGGTPQSVVRAASLALPLTIAIIGGEPERFAPFASLYREAASRAGHDPAKLAVGVNSHGLVADDSQQAADIFFPPYAATMSKIGGERGWPPVSRAHFDSGLDLRGWLMVGDPDKVIEKILYQNRFFGHQRYLMQMTVGPTPHAAVMRSIELFATKVAPAVRAEVARRGAAGE
jgi:probable LLM family oxidoreductase